MSTPTNKLPTDLGKDTRHRVPNHSFDVSFLRHDACHTSIWAGLCTIFYEKTEKMKIAHKIRFKPNVRAQQMREM